jgi:hypothetical protein
MIMAHGETNKKKKFINWSSVPGNPYIKTRQAMSTYNVTLRGVHETTVAVKKQ